MGEKMAKSNLDFADGGLLRAPDYYGLPIERSPEQQNVIDMLTESDHPWAKFFTPGGFGDDGNAPGAPGENAPGGIGLPDLPDWVNNPDYEPYKPPNLQEYDPSTKIQRQPVDVTMRHILNQFGPGGPTQAPTAGMTLMSQALRGNYAPAGVPTGGLLTNSMGE